MDLLVLVCAHSGQTPQPQAARLIALPNNKNDALKLMPLEGGKPVGE